MYKRQDIYREIIKDNIDYDILKQDMKFDSDRLDEIVDLMLETCLLYTSIPTFRLFWEALRQVCAD